ncbi:hypothetical protein ACMA1D_06765 [Streptomyces sp. 796.1]|uniref:hypothetical protein n=1 Tax=Streptomyces sp. 796.1 TaxID=3163029 RepID=UPI0039C8F45C
MEAELAALAGTGAATLVALMVSDAWTRGRASVARFLSRRRGGAAEPDDVAAVEAELQRSSAALTRARETGDERVTADAEQGLRARLGALLAEDPAAAEELRRLLAEVAPLAADGLTVNALSGGTHHAPVFQGSHLHGDITFHVPAPRPSGPAVRPDQVPALTTRFINRRADLAVLDGCFGRAGHGADHPVVGVLTGLPGVGKTATTWRWADTARAAFPDGQIYVDFAALRRHDRPGLRGPADDPGADVSEAAAMCLRALGVGDDFMPRSLAERTALFRSRSAALRLLVVLDDVNQPAQVRALIPKGKGSAVLVTGQGALGELAMAGATMIPLEPLDAEGGLALLADRCGEAVVAAEQEAAGRLVTLCGGLPIALQVVAARLGMDAGLTMTALAAELEDETGRLAGLSLGAENPVTAVFGLAYRQLPPPAARLYRLLGRLPMDTFDAGVAAVAADRPAAETRSLLATLVGAGLLTPTDDRRYRLHGLVRLHAHECDAAEQTPVDQAALTERVTLHYLVLTALADRALRKDRLRIADLADLLRDATDPFAATGGPAPLEWLDVERASVLAVLRAAARQAQHRPALHTRVWQLAEAFTALFLHRRYLGAWQESLELGADAAAAAVAPAAEARLRALLSRPLMDLGAHERARRELETAVACAEIADDLVLRASVQEFLGRYWDRFDPERAIIAYETSLDLNRRAQEPRGVAIAAYFLGCAQAAGGDHGRALATLRDARRDLLAGSEPDLRMAGRVTAAIGDTLDRAGETAAAVDALQQAAADLRAAEATSYEAQALIRLADIAERTGGHGADVRGWLTRALEIHEAGGSPQVDALRARIDGLPGDDQG